MSSIVRIQVERCEVRDVRVMSMPLETKIIITSDEDEITWQNLKYWDDEEGDYFYTMIGSSTRKDEEHDEEWN